MPRRPPAPIGLLAVAFLPAAGLRAGVIGRELVVRIGSEARDLAGNVLPGLEGWKLVLVSDDVAAFSNGRDDAVFHRPRNQ